MQAVVPPPDGGYPGGNTAEGQDALLSLTTGLNNTALGSSSLRAITTGKYCTAVGASALGVNTADVNTAIGAGTLFSNTTGSQNTANGALALFSNTTGVDNTANGYYSLVRNNTGSQNTANGAFALAHNTSGNYNTASGYNALGRDTTGFQNTAIGTGALSNNTTGSGNTAVGNGTLPLGEDGAEKNTAIGINALGSLASGIGTTAVGADAMSNSITSEGNTALGVRALQNTRTFGTFGINNTAVGADTLVNNTLGSSNIALGWQAGNNITDAANVICIGAAGENVNNTCYIGNIYAQVSARGTAVFVNSDGKLGTFSSSRRFKEEIKPMEHASEALFALKPVTFRYKKGIDPQGTPQFGLVAEDVEAVNPDLVVSDNKGTVDTVRYEAINAMLLNEFLKQHYEVGKQTHKMAAADRKIREQDATIAGLKNEIACLVTTVKEQAAQIQKVSAEVELNRPQPEQVAFNIPQASANHKNGKGEHLYEISKPNSDSDPDFRTWLLAKSPGTKSGAGRRLSQRQHG